MKKNDQEARAHCAALGRQLAAERWAKLCCGHRQRAQQQRHLQRGPHLQQGGRHGGRA